MFALFASLAAAAGAGPLSRPGAAGLEFYHPEYQSGPDIPPLEKALTPVYPTTEGVSQKLLRNLAAQGLQWLQTHAPDHGFVLSYPRGNRYGYIYEPWHWCYQGAAA